jgi:hypothetical protein
VLIFVLQTLPALDPERTMNKQTQENLRTAWTSFETIFVTVCGGRCRTVETGKRAK